MDGLTVEISKECVNCPRLELETIDIFRDFKGSYKVHKCKHKKFCDEVKAHWETCVLARMEESYRKANDIS